MNYLITARLKEIDQFNVVSNEINWTVKQKVEETITKFSKNLRMGVLSIEGAYEEEQIKLFKELIDINKCEKSIKKRLF